MAAITGLFKLQIYFGFEGEKKMFYQQQTSKRILLLLI